MAEQRVRLRRISSLHDFLTRGRSARFNRQFRVEIRTYANNTTSGQPEVVTMNNVSLTNNTFMVPLPTINSGEMGVVVAIVDRRTRSLLMNSRRFVIGPNDANSLNGRDLEMFFVADWADALVRLRNDLAESAQPDLVLYNALDGEPLELFDQAWWVDRFETVRNFLDSGAGVTNPNTIWADENLSSRFAVSLASRARGTYTLLRPNGRTWATIVINLRLEHPPAGTSNLRVTKTSFTATRPAPNRLQAANRAELDAWADAGVTSINNTLGDGRQQYWNHSELLEQAMVRAGQPAFTYQSVTYSGQSTSITRAFDDPSPFGVGRATAYRPVFCGGVSRPRTLPTFTATGTLRRV